MTQTPPTASTVRRFAWLLPLLLAGGAMIVLTAKFAYDANGAFGFPLDDAWIHLQFAKNLHAYGSFSYFENHMVTSGSTSPLYTMLLAAGMFITHNEFLLSYFWGALFFLAASVFLYRIVLRLTGSILFASAAALLLLLEPHLQWIAL
jgi:hypothetical protein